MSKFKKKKGGELPAISTASLPDIVFMLLFFFMVVTVLRDSNLLVQQKLPKGDQVEKLKKDRSIFPNWPLRTARTASRSRPLRGH